MRILVNGDEIKTTAMYLEGLLSELGFEGEWLATAVNSELVSSNERNSFKLTENDRIEILSPMQGG